MVSVRLSSYGCAREASKHDRKESHEAIAPQEGKQDENCVAQRLFEEETSE